MKQVTAILTLAISGALIIGAYFFGTTDRAKTQSISVHEGTSNIDPEPISNVTDVSLNAEQSADRPLASNVSENLGREGGIESEWSRVWVRPLNPLHTNCSMEWVAVEGELPEQTEKCTDSHVDERHPYYEYADETLENLAYGEALAAAILSERFYESDPEKAHQLGVRAAAISGKPGPLMRIAYDLFPVGYEHIVWQDGEIDVSKIEAHFVLASAAQRMGYSDADPMKLADTYELDADTLELRVVDLLEQLATTQEAVSGSTQLKERFSSAGSAFEAGK